MVDDDPQSRLQDYGVDIAVDAFNSRPRCIRCGDEVSEDQQSKEVQTRVEYETGYYNVEDDRGWPTVCEDCEDLQDFLKKQYRALTSDIGVSGAVAVHCQCHDDDEVEVQAVRRGESAKGRQCSRCGSGNVVIEELPPKENAALPGDVR